MQSCAESAYDCYADSAQLNILNAVAQCMKSGWMGLTLALLMSTVCMCTRDDIMICTYIGGKIDVRSSLHK